MRVKPRSRGTFADPSMPNTPVDLFNSPQVSPEVPLQLLVQPLWLNVTDPGRLLAQKHCLRRQRGRPARSHRPGRHNHIFCPHLANEWCELGRVHSKEKRYETPNDVPGSCTGCRSTGIQVAPRRKCHDRPVSRMMGRGGEPATCFEDSKQKLRGA